MQGIYQSFSTGLPGLDDVLTGVRPGDNIVWQVDRVEDYVPFVHRFCQEAAARHQPLVYFRFAQHEELLPPGIEAEVHRLHPERGFEDFIDEIFDVIERIGVGGCYVFDCLSELAVDWYSDRMLGNFFMLTCPYLYDYKTATFFGLLRNHHTPTATGAIHGTAQVVIDVHRNGERLFVHPLKVYKRHSETMYMLHEWENDRFPIVTKSATISEILTSLPQTWLDFTIREADVWTRTFREANALVETGRRGRQERAMQRKLLGMVVTRDARVAKLAEKHLRLTDLVEIGKRMIGTGLIGGKSVGMLLARSILRHSTDRRWQERLEPHDSFFVGSDVFYTYLVQNGSWWVRRQLKDTVTAVDRAQEARQRLSKGVFPKDIQDQFQAMLEYFGQSPIIVRSSSLLEDAYGNAFSGKYESVFCANQGTPAERLEQFMDAVRTVYASTMSRDALLYRARWGLLDRDEQMALLVQRVSGQQYGTLFYPQLAGVGFSFNPFVWSSDIDPKAGFLRLVFGLGTRAVDRVDDDYTRLVALNAPERAPVASAGDARRYAQHNVDVLDLRANHLLSRTFEEVAKASPGLPIQLFASRDAEIERQMEERRLTDVFPWFLHFDHVAGRTDFIRDMRDLLATLETAYAHPVDMEFTANFVNDDEYRINVLQCRPFQVRGGGGAVRDPGAVPDERVVIETRGPVIGRSVMTRIDRIIYVVPATYSELTMQDRYAVARIIGQLTHLRGDAAAETVCLIGPGRWGTTTPALGVPVALAEIDTVRIICELAMMREGVVPDVSLGTHFFNDLVELDMLYLGICPGREGHRFSVDLLAAAPNRLGDLLPGAEPWANVVRVIDSRRGDAWNEATLYANVLDQKAVCFLGAPANQRARARRAATPSK
jgi:pyruvate, water dikinase